MYVAPTSTNELSAIPPGDPFSSEWEARALIGTSDLAFGLIGFWPIEGAFCSCRAALRPRVLV